MAHNHLLRDWFFYAEQPYKLSGIKINLKPTSWNNCAEFFYLSSEILPTDNVRVIGHVKFLRAPIDHKYNNDLGARYVVCNNVTSLTQFKGWSRETYWYHCKVGLNGSRLYDSS